MSATYEAKFEEAIRYAENLPVGITGYDRADTVSMLRSAQKLTEGLSEDQSDETEEAVFRAVDSLYTTRALIELTERAYPSRFLRTLAAKITDAIEALQRFGKPIL